MFVSVRVLTLSLVCISKIYLKSLNTLKHYKSLKKDLIINYLFFGGRTHALLQSPFRAISFIVATTQNAQELHNLSNEILCNM